MKYTTIALSSLYQEMNKFTVSEDFGYLPTGEADGTVYIGSAEPFNMITYCIHKLKGPFLVAKVENDLQAPEDSGPTETAEAGQRYDKIASLEDANNSCNRSQCITLASLVNAIDEMSELGVFMDMSKALTPAHPNIFILDSIDTEAATAEIAELVIQKVLEGLTQLHGRPIAEADVNQCGPRFLYLGYFSSYEKCRDINEIVGDRIGSSIIYYNMIQYMEAKTRIDTKIKNQQFSTIINSVSIEEQLVFDHDTASVKKFAHKRFEDGRWVFTDFDQRDLSLKFDQVLYMYNIIQGNIWKVFSFDKDTQDMALDTSFYAPLTLAQQNFGIKVLMPNATAYTTMLSTMCNMPFADFFTRTMVYRDLYGPGKLRLLKDEAGGVTRIAVTKGYSLNIQFSGINVDSIKRFIKKDKNGKLAITLDSHIVEDEALDLLTNKDFVLQNSSNTQVKPVDALNLLGSALADMNMIENGYYTQEFEEFLYTLCRVIDQLLLKYTGFTTLRDLAAFKIEDKKHPGRDKFYIGIGKIHPELTCDVVVLSDEGILIPDIKYTGNVLDINWIDDINNIMFKKDVDSDVSLTFLDKIAHIYENGGRTLPPEILNLERSKTARKTGRQLLMSLLYGAFASTPVSLTQNIFKLAVQIQKQVMTLDKDHLTDDPFLPIYIGLTLSSNYLGDKYMKQQVLDVTTSYGYRQLPMKDSPLNLFGGLNLDCNSNLWLYPQLFQHHRRESTIKESDYGR